VKSMYISRPSDHYRNRIDYDILVGDIMYTSRLSGDEYHV
jgi:hypothetical protein